MAILTSPNYDGKHHDDNSISNCINYILRPDKAIHGYYGYSGFGARLYSVPFHRIGQSLTEAMKELEATNKRKDTIKIRHFIVSFAPWELNDPQIADQIARRCIAYFASEYQTVYGVHEDTGNLHFHIAVNPVSFVDGCRYRGQHAEFNYMRVFFTDVLNEFGIHTLHYQAQKKTSLWQQ